MKSTIRRNKYNIIAFVVAFAAIGGIVMLIATRAATPVTVDNSLPNPTNVRAYADDRVATVTWDAPGNAASSNIVGYYITWGTQSGGVYTNAKQSTYTITQIQPLVNGTVYNIKVQSVQGNTVNVTNSGAYNENASEARANGKVSSGVTTTVNPSSARVDKLRSEMTGFFDDFNTPAGAFDELKWNNASTCTFYGSNGAFINNQFHAHNQIRSGGYNESLAPCWDRGQMASRARGVFDITGATEQDPGEVVFDFDGVQFGRDVWYMDFVPVNERRTGIPIDVGTHQGSDDDLANPTIATEPKMIRMAQMGASDGSGGLIHFMYYGDDQRPHEIVSTAGCSDQFRGFMKFSNCGGSPQVTSLSPLPEPNVFTWPSKFPIANSRQHWRMQMTSTKMKLYINNVLMWEGPMPADFRNTTKYHVYSSLFSYNTGKDQYVGNSTTMLHWDNFGFTGPAPTTVTHNYIDGGTNGTTPYYLGPGTSSNRIPVVMPRSTKVNIPDVIGSPVQARLMFTLSATGYSGSYPWGPNDKVTVNNKDYSVPNPATDLNGPSVPRFNDNGTILPASAGYSVAVILNAADLKQGMNDVSINLASASGAVMTSNLHIELEYPKNSAPAYTQPSQVFGAATFLAAIQPTMTSHDNYLFIEQDMGLPTGVIATAPGGTDTVPPTVSISAPVNGASVQKGTSLTVQVNATDNISVDKVELYLDNSATPNHTITHTPYSHALDSSNWSVGNHTIKARAYDTTGNRTDSQTITFIVSDPTPPPTTIPGDLNNDGKVNVFDLSTLLSNWGRTGATKAQGDVDGNGTVNIFDMSTLLANWSR